MSIFINFAILKYNRNFRLLFLGQCISFFGTMVTSVALPYQIYHLTYSTLMVGLLSLAQLLPLLVTALIGGVLADRHHRRTLLLWSEFLLAIGCILLAINAYFAEPSLSVIFIVAMVMSAINGLHRPALDSIKQQIVDKKDFTAVSSLSMSVISLVMIAGPALGGIIIAHFGIVTTFLVDLATFTCSLISLLLMKDILKPKWLHDQSTLTALKSGLRYAVSRQELLGTYFVDFFAMVFGMPSALFPAIAHSFGGVKTLGLLYAAPAFGALLFSLFSGFAKHIKRYGVAIAISASLWGVSIIFFGLAKNLIVALFFLSLAGGFDAISGIFRGILWNETIENEYRGRLAGIEMISYLSGPKLGDTEAGLVAAAFGISFSIISGGALCIATVALCCYFLPRFWHFRSNIPLVSQDAKLQWAKSE